MVQLGYILSLTRWRKYHRNAARLRIIQVVLGAPSTDSEARCETLKQARAAKTLRLLLIFVPGSPHVMLLIESR